MELTDVGVFCKKNSKFYYMEYGNLTTPPQTVERILKTLVSRGLIVYDTEPGRSVDHTTLYQVLSVKDAQDRNMKLEPIYVSDHVRKVVEARQAEGTPDQKVKWGKRAE